MTCIHDKKVNKLSECNLLHDIINSFKRTKNINSHYYLILHGCINTQKGRARFDNFRILLYSGCTFTIVMVGLIKNLLLKKILRFNETRKQMLLLTI